MTTIRSRCPRCGDVDMPASSVRLLRRERREYTYVCPTCGDFIVKVADEKIVALLLGAGVSWSDDAPRHPEMFDKDAPPITLDDLIDLHREMEEW